MMVGVYAVIAALLSFDFFFGFPSGVGTPLGCILILALSHQQAKGLKDRYALSWLINAYLLVFVMIGAIAASGQIAFIVTMAKVFMVMACLPLLANKLASDQQQADFLKGQAVAWLLQAMFVVACFIVPGANKVGNFFRPPITSGLYAAIESEGTGARLFPASGQLISGLAVVAAATFCIFFWALYYSRRHRAWMIVGALSTAIVGTVSGRSFFVGVLLCLLFLAYLRPRAALSLGLAFAGAFGLILVLLFYYNPSFAFWAFEPIINFATGAGLHSKSTDALITHHYFTPDAYNVLLPSFRYTTLKGFSAGTDSGFLRYLLFGGPVFLVLFFLGFYFSLVKRFPRFKLAPLFTLVLLILVTIKQESLTNASMVASLLMLNAFAFGPGWAPTGTGALLEREEVQPLA